MHPSLTCWQTCRGGNTSLFAFGPCESRLGRRGSQAESIQQPGTERSVGLKNQLEIRVMPGESPLVTGDGLDNLTLEIMPGYVLVLR